jgi:hypothetical protein
MYEGSCNQNAGTEMLGTEEEGRRNAKAREFGDEQGEATASRRHEEDDEKATDVESKIVIRLRMARFAGSSLGEAMSRWMTYGTCQLS